MDPMDLTDFTDGKLRVESWHIAANKRVVSVQVSNDKSVSGIALTREQAAKLAEWLTQWLAKSES
jgi:predicted solute-binding protein